MHAFTHSPYACLNMHAANQLTAHHLAPRPTLPEFQVRKRLFGLKHDHKVRNFCRVCVHLQSLPPPAMTHSSCDGQIRDGRRLASAALTTDTPSSTSSSHTSSERATRHPGSQVQQGLPKLTGKTVVISGGSQVCGQSDSLTWHMLRKLQ